MRKIYVIFFVLFLIVTANAQTEKQKPPPPPPKPKVEKVNATSPEGAKEEIKPLPPKIVKVGKEKPPLPKVIKEEGTPEPPVITIKGDLADEFYERNPTISEISRKGNIITLKMKDGTIEKYDMSKKEEDKNFTDKYGRSPIPPPPPPPKVIKTKT